MARKRTELPPSARRNEILDAAQRFVASKGFEQMTIEDILADLNISKGAFYHYFESKGVLLEALISRMGHESRHVLMPILVDPQLTALQKVQRWFDTAAQWKTTRKEFLLSLIRTWYHDDNAVVRLKLRSDTLAWINPMLTQVIQQGIEEGVFRTSYPEQVGQVVYSLLYDLGDSLADKLVSAPTEEGSYASAQATTAAFTDAVERALGAPSGSLSMIDPEMLREWYSAPTAVA
jgi:AcrR family transcriptional regulator